MFEKILAPIDGSKTSDRWFSQSARLARIYGSHVRLLYVLTGSLHDHAVERGQYPSSFLATLRGCAQGVLNEAARLIAAQGVGVEQTLIDSIGAPASESILLEAKSWQADLIVMGTHGRKGYRPHEFGTDASAVLRNSPIPVMLVHGIGHGRGMEKLSARGLKQQDRPTAIPRIPRLL